MKKQRLSPKSRADVRYVDDEELAYVMKRYREVHDVWHVLYGVTEVTVLAEVALKWVEVTQTALPMNAIASVVGPLRLTSEERVVLWENVLPWVRLNAKYNTFLLAVPYEENWSMNVEEMRKENRVTPLKL